MQLNVTNVSSESLFRNLFEFNFILQVKVC